jgi:hypothetical protein
MRFVMSLRAWTVALALLAAACGPGAKSPGTPNGEPLTTGNAAYDAFFREVAEVKKEAEKAGSDLADASRPLNDALGPQGSSAAPSDAVRTQAKKLQMSGTLLHLDLVPEAKMVTSTKPDASSEKLLAAVEQTAKGSLAIVRRSSDVLVRITDLEKRRVDLLGTAPAMFPDENKRNQVTGELSVAEATLKAARALGDKHGGAASKLSLDLAMAIETGAGSGALASGKKPKAGGGGAKPAGTGVAAPAKPKGGGDDFDK